jgi:alpha-tubulin suppressor-like RCC1 family protein
MFFRDLLLKAQTPYASNQLFNWGLGTSGQLGYGILPGSFTQIVGGPSHAAGITSNGSLMMWGLGTNGQLGDGFQLTRSNPTQIPGTWLSVAVGDIHTVAVRGDNTLFAWGLNSSGQIGDGTTINKSSPVQIGTLNNWSKVGAGTSNTYAATLTGSLYGWGVNNAGQVGDSTTLNRSSPVLIGSNSWTAVSAGTSFATAIRSDGTLYAWGLNSQSQLGNALVANQSSPIQIGLNNSWTTVSAGQSHTAAVRNDGTLWVWGIATAIGLQGNQAYSWTKIASGSGSHSAAIRSDGSLWTWGLGASGQIGDGQTLTRSSPTVVGVGTWTDVAVGPSHTAAVSSDGKLFAWGLGTSGQLGDNTLISKSSPVQIAAGTSFINVALGTLHGLALDSASRLYAWGQQASVILGGNVFPENTLVSKAYNNGNNGALIRTDGTLWVWGYNVNGTIGDSTNISKSSPVQVAGSWTTLSVGSGHILGIKSDNTLWAWGSNASGQLGLGTTVDRNSPVQIGALANWSTVSAGTNFSLATNTLGQIYAWGVNNLGQLGDGTTINKSSPVNYGLTSWTAVSAGSSHSMAISSDGNLFTWGYGLAGNLGHNNTQSLSNPTKITTVTKSWTQIAAGWLQSHAITTLGEKYSWGGNGGGQLGIGTSTGRSIPTIVPGSTSWTQVAANFQNSYAIDTLGKLYSAGVNQTGALGLNYNSNSIQVSNYTQITPGVSYTFISAGSIGVNAAAVSTEPRYYAWGDNSNGQIGNNDTLNKTGPFSLLNSTVPAFSTPSQVGSDYFNKVTAGVSYSIGLKTDYTLWSWGLNSGGQLGEGTITTRSSPTQIGNYFNLGPLSYNTVSAGASHVLAVSSTNKLYLWGINTSTLINNQVFSWTQLVVGQLHGVAIRNDGLLFAWGTNAQGQFGNNTAFASTTSPILVSTSSWSVVAAGASNTSAIRSDGTLWAWGDNTYGQLGQGDTGISRSSPTQIGVATNWSKIANGNYSLMAIDTSGNMYGVGINTSGNLGVGDLNNRSTLTIVPGGITWGQVSAGNQTTGAIDTGGGLWMFGAGTSGQIGNGTAATRSTPTQITGNTWNKVSVGSSHVIAIRSDTTLWAWGIGSSGQVGQGTTAVSRSSPVLVAAAGIGGVSSYTQISAGLDFNVALKVDGTLWGWGVNTGGQLGDNTAITKSAPVQLATGTSFNAVGSFGSGLNQWAGAIATNNTIYNWGTNNVGQIADSTAITKSSPVQLGSSGLMGSMSYPVQVTAVAGSWSSVAAGTSFSLATKTDGTLWGWGLNTSSQLGDNTVVTKSSPVQVSAAGTSSYTQVAATAATGFGIQTNNLLWGWGLGTSGQVGDITIATKAVPTNVGNLNTGIVAATGSPYQVGSGSSYTQVGAGLSFTAALRSDGAAFAWGLNSSGQIGQGNVTTYSSPVQIGTSSYAQVSAGGATWYGILGNKLLLVSGLGTSGQLGDASLVNKSTPVLVINTVIASASSPVQVGALSWSKVSAGSTHTAAIRSDGLLFEWGLGANGALAVTPTDTNNRSSPVQVGTSSWNAVSAGKSNFTLAIRSDNTLWGWGLNASYQLGVADSVDRSIPVQISAPVQLWTKISAGLSASAGIDLATGFLYTWGLDTSGILGSNQTASTIRSLPVQVTTSSWSQVSVGLSHMLGINSTGSMYAWGFNNNYRLGDGTSITKSSPTLVGGSNSWVSISAGADHSVAIKSDLTLWAWGNGATGALGIVSLPYSWTQITEGNSFAVGLRSDNTIWSWGTNSLGQLGLGDVINRSSPVQIGTDNSWNFIYSGQANSGAIRNDGVLFTWGLNSSQQLGDGTAINKSSPVQVLGTYSFSQAAAGLDHVIAIGANNVGLYTWGPIASTNASNADLSYTQISEGAGGHTVAIRWDGYLFAWGNNNAGQLGKINAITYSSPVQVGAEQWSLVSAGASHTLGIDSAGRLWAWGLNSTYQLGTGDAISYSSPVLIGADSSWIGIAAGFSHSMALRSDGLLFAWGVGTLGQQGALTATRSWSNISAGATHAAGVSTSKLYVWGLNTSSQLGLIDAVNRSSPTLISTDASSWKSVSAGSTHTLFTQYDNSTWAVGINSAFQVGDGTSVNRNSPVLVGAGVIIVDSSNTPHSITNNNGTNYTTSTIPVTGSVSGYFPGTNINILSTVSTDYAIGASTDFTVECWIDPVNWLVVAGGRYDAILEVTDGTNIWTLGISNPGFTGVWVFASSVEGGWSGYRGTVSSTYNWNTDGWHHFAIVRQSGVYRLYVDGVGSTTATFTNQALTTGSTTIKVGPYLNAYVSNLRFVKGTAVYTGNFTPPSLAVLGVSGATSSAAYPSTTNVNTTFNAANTVLLLYTTPGASISGGPILYTSISAGSSHSSGINAAGQLFVWGQNSSWQLGDGTSVNKSSPTQIVSGTSSYTQVSLGLSTSGAVDSLGRLWVWGTGTGGQLAQVSNVLNQSYPVQVATGTSWSQISMGYSHTLAVKSDGTLWAWGKNSDGQLGIWTSVPAGVNTSSPVQVPAPGTNWSSISAGISHSLGIQTNGTIWGWGANDVGQVGYIPAAGSLYSWTQVKMAINATAGITHVAAIRSDGSLWTWGNNAVGQLGVGDSANRSSPVQVGGLSNYSQISLGASHTLAVKSDGTLWGWGSNANWQLGLGAADSINRSSPVQISAGDSWSAISAGSQHSSGIDTYGKLFYWGTTVPTQNIIWSWTSISVGGSHTVGIRNDGKLFTWGSNTGGQLGDGTTLSRSSPNQVGNSSWSAISAGGGFTLAIKPDGTLWTWGSNGAGQLGLRDGVFRSSPTQVTIPSITWSKVSGGGIHALAIDTSGLLYAWGLGSSGELGQGNAASYSSPTPIGLSNWSVVSAGQSFSLAIDSTGRLFGFGAGQFGRLGLYNTAGIVGDPTVNRSSPVQIGTGLWSAVAAGMTHAVGVRSDGTLYAWGNGVNGELGYGTAASRSSPTQINVGVSGYSQVLAGNGISAALKTDGTLFAWGLGTNGETGFNTAVNRSIPVQVLAAVNFSTLATGANSGDHMAALSSLGLLYTWGNGNAGQTGVGDVQSRSSPVNIGTTTGAAGSLSTNQYLPARIGTSSYTSVSAGQSYQTAIDTNYRLVAWGNNASGQLGIGNVATYSSPVIIGATSSWSQVQATLSFTYGILATTSALYSWGDNGGYQLGRFDLIARSSPVLTNAAATASFSQITAGSSWGMGITTALAGNYALYTWGGAATYETGQLGVAISVPTQLGTATSWTAIGGSAAINNNATLYIWGTSASGQQGEGTTYARSSPVILGYKINIVSPVQIASGSWSQVEAGKGSGFSLARDSNGTFYGWGQDSTGQIGI